MLNYVHNIPTKLYFGKGQIENLPNILQEYGKNVLMVYGGGSIKKIGLYDTIINLLNQNNFKVIECDGIEPNPRIQSVEKGVKLARENNCDVILAVGGGSTIDAAKAIAVAYYYDGPAWDVIIKPAKVRKALPLVDILTLSATGSEFDGGGVISNPDTNEKLGAPLTHPSASICDPTYTYSVNKYQTAAGSADIMSHILEGYFSRTDDVELSDGIAETILKTVIKYLPIALKEPDNYIARGNLMMCSSVACSGIPEYGKQYSGWPCHAMEHQLSAYYDITHGVGLAILTPRWMRYILEKDPSTTDRFVKFAKNVWGLEGQGKELALQGIQKLEDFFKENNIPITLSELNIDETYFEDMAIKANRNDRVAKSYVPLEKEDVINIFKACL